MIHASISIGSWTTGQSRFGSGNSGFGDGRLCESGFGDNTFGVGGSGDGDGDDGDGVGGVESDDMTDTDGRGRWTIRLTRDTTLLIVALGQAAMRRHRQQCSPISKSGEVMIVLLNGRGRGSESNLSFASSRWYGII